MSIKRCLSTTFYGLGESLLQFSVPHQLFLPLFFLWFLKHTVTRCEWPSMKTNRFLTMFVTFFTFCTMKSRRGKKLFLFYKLHENDLKNTECEEETQFPYGFLFTDFKSMLKHLHNFPETWNIKFKQQIIG